MYVLTPLKNEELMIVLFLKAISSLSFFRDLIQTPLRVSEYSSGVRVIHYRTVIFLISDYFHNTF